MRFDFKALFTAISSLYLILSFLTLSVVAASAQPTAVVPQNIIYPGQQISYAMVKEVDVINPNLRPGYAKVIAEVEGLVTTRTLLPGRIIPVNALREAYLVERGKIVSLVFANRNMMITAQAVALQNGGLGEVIRARNADSGLIISGTVMQDGTLRAMPK